MQLVSWVNASVRDAFVEIQISGTSVLCLPSSATRLGCLYTIECEKIRLEIHVAFVHSLTKEINGGFHFLNWQTTTVEFSLENSEEGNLNEYAINEKK